MKSDLCSECNNPVIVENVLLMATKYMDSGMLLIVLQYVQMFDQRFEFKTE